MISRLPAPANSGRFPWNRRMKLMGIAMTSMLIAGILFVWWRFDHDIQQAAARTMQGSVLAATHCGPSEYQEAGTGVPLLMVHGSGGGHDQGMAFARSLARQGVRVIAISRFGYLRTPMPPDASPAAQADAHVCLLDALGIRRVAVLGGSAGGPSAMQMAIRHPDRVSALVLLVPLAYKPGALADSAPPISPMVEKIMMRLIGSDFLFWTGTQVARNALIKLVLATPPERVAAASPQERARVNAMLDNILPVSARAAGLRSDSVLGKGIPRYALEAIRAPTLVISARDDGYGTYAGAQYTASQIAGAKFVGFNEGGHTWVGHDAEVQLEILKLLGARGQP
jgi:2-hydroxy-6-oxonona-2,4-dienedioate hydrolase